MAENGATSLTTQPLLKTTQTQTLSKGSTWAIVCSAKQHYLFTELSAGLCPPAVSSTAAQVAAAAVGCAPTPPFLHSHTKSKRGCTKVRRPANPGVSQNHSTAWVGRNLEDRSVLTPLLAWAGCQTTSVVQIGASNAQQTLGFSAGGSRLMNFHPHR